MASNKHVGLRKNRKEKKENKRKKANFRKSSKNFKIFDGNLTYKGKIRMIFNNDRKILILQCHSILLSSSTHLRTFNCKKVSHLNDLT